MEILKSVQQHACMNYKKAHAVYTVSWLQFFKLQRPVSVPKSGMCLHIIH